MKNLSQENIRVKSIPAWENNNCKGCKVGKGSVCSKNKASSMARRKQVKQRILEKKPRK